MGREEGEGLGEGNVLPRALRVTCTHHRRLAPQVDHLPEKKKEHIITVNKSGHMYCVTPYKSKPVCASACRPAIKHARQPFTAVCAPLIINTGRDI